MHNFGIRHVCCYFFVSTQSKQDMGTLLGSDRVFCGHLLKLSGGFVPHCCCSRWFLCVFIQVHLQEKLDSCLSVSIMNVLCVPLSFFVL